VVVAVAAGFWLFRSDLPRPAKPSAGTRIVAFGDSLVEGRGATRDRDFVSVLSKRIGLPIVNAGRSGDTTRSALERVNQDVLARNPRVVIVLLGGNDFLRRIPREETFKNLTSIVARIRGRGAAVVVVGISNGFFTDSHREDYEQVARRTSAGLVPDILDGIIGHGDRMSDSIHPNDRGYQMIADRIEPVLRDVIRPE
jgi:acyl-CoA thioesterase-1